MINDLSFPHCYLHAANDLSQNDQMEPSRFCLESEIESQETKLKKHRDGHLIIKLHSIGSQITIAT